MEASNKLVDMCYIFQNKNGTWMTATLKTKDFIEEEDEENKVCLKCQEK